MKNIFFTAAFLASTILAVNASENTELKSNKNEVEIPKHSINNDDKTVNVYHWYVKTENSVFTGAEETLKEAKNRINAISNKAVIISKNIRYITMDNNTEKIYTWGVANDKGNASGVSRNLADAQKMVTLMNEGDVSRSRIIESFKMIK